MRETSRDQAATVPVNINSQYQFKSVNFISLQMQVIFNLWFRSI